jgi:hypothetical protein
MFYAIMNNVLASFFDSCRHFSAAIAERQTRPSFRRH